MAVTRKMLKAMGIEDEKIEQIIEAHSETVDGLKSEMDALKSTAKSDADKVVALQKELDDTKALVLEKEGKNPWKVKYDALHEEFEGYKTEEQKKATKAAKESAYRALLKETGIAEKRIASVVRVSDIDSLELGEDGKFKNNDDLVKKIKEDWSDFIATESTKGAETTTPPANNGAEDNDDSSAVSRVIAQRAAMYGAQK
ncbi:MAG: hypothetical protein IKX20_11190 [Paludibacteraceae bacterium]|nr:hypothetical protein [Paludibacteraceae bacterium]